MRPVLKTKITFRIPLKTESFTLGKTEGDYIIKETDVGKDLFKTISRTQCEIIKNKDGVFLKDFSSNGKIIFHWFLVETFFKFLLFCLIFNH